MKTLRGQFRRGTILAAALAAVLAGCEPGEETAPQIPIESTNNGDAAEAEDAGDGNGEESGGEGEESGDEESDDEESDDEESGDGESGDGGEAAEGKGEVFEITADDAMRFGLARFEVDPGQRVTVVLENIGSLSKEVMGHNFVLLELGTDPMAFANAAIAHRDNEHIPPGREDEVIVATDILGPGETEEITFIAPDSAGDYDYICSFPGHAVAGMVGVMTVRAEGDEDSEEGGAEETGDGSDQEGDETEGNGEAGEEERDGEQDQPEENGEADGEEEAGEALSAPFTFPFADP